MFRNREAGFLDLHIQGRKIASLEAICHLSESQKDA